MASTASDIAIVLIRYAGPEDLSSALLRTRANCYHSHETDSMTADHIPVQSTIATTQAICVSALLKQKHLQATCNVRQFCLDKGYFNCLDLVHWLVPAREKQDCF